MHGDKLAAASWCALISAGNRGITAMLEARSSPVHAKERT